MAQSTSKHIQSPFSTISTELLNAIFDCIFNNEPIYLPLQPSEPRKTVSLVCKRWFNTVRSTCSFWDKVHFTQSLPDTTAHESYPLLKQLAFCVNLSGKNPLTINIDMICNGWAFSLVHFVIIPHTHRIKVLSCPIYDNDDIITFLTIPEGDFSILESLEVWFINTPTNPTSSFPLDICLRFGVFRTAPRLREAIVYLSNDLHPFDLCLPWGQLTTLDLGTTSMSLLDFIKIMDATAIRLEDAFLSIKCANILNPDLVLWKDSITMKALQNLRLRLFFPSQDMRLFSVLQLPSLQIFRVEMHDRYQDWDIRSYTKLLRGSTQSLRRLDLSDYPPPERTDTGLVVRRRYCETSPLILDEFFDVISNIEYLHLPLGLEVHAATLEKMASFELLPRLEALVQVGANNGWLILSMAKRRQMHLLNAPFVVKPRFETDSSRQPILKSLRHLKYLYMLIPRQSYGAAAKRALVEEAQALALLGIECHVQTTQMLPVPMTIGYFT